MICGERGDVDALQAQYEAERARTDAVVLEDWRTVERERAAVRAIYAERVRRQLAGWPLDKARTFARALLDAQVPQPDEARRIIEHYAAIDNDAVRLGL